jgi:hypothetical protein
MTDNRPIKGIKKEKPVDAPSLVEKIVDSIHKDIIEVIETIKETDK